MGLLYRLKNFFSRVGRDENRLQQGMEHAQAKRPREALAAYDALLGAKGTSPVIRARALLNRALAYSSLKDDTKALLDLEALVAQPGVPENVRQAARDQLVRVRQRVERARTRAESRTASASH